MRSPTDSRLDRWTRPRPRHDGIPATAFGPWDALEWLLMHDFGLVHPQFQRRGERFESHPTIAVLSTGGDLPADWVRAGQALQRVFAQMVIRLGYGSPAPGTPRRPISEVLEQATT